MGLQYTFASSYGSGDRGCDSDGNQRCDRRAGNCNQSGGQSGDNFSWERCTGGAKPFDQGGWLYRREISLGIHGSSGSKHRCFSVCSPYLGYEAGAKQSPCTDSNQRRFIGYAWKGKGGWHGNNDNVRANKFANADTALQCQFDVNADKLKTWSNKSYITKAGAKDDNGRFMNQYDQMLWGIRIKDGLEQQTGFCNTGNADTVVHQNGKTCQELAADNFSSLPTNDSRWAVWDTLTDATCSKTGNLTKKVKPNSDETCLDRDTTKTLAKQWCSDGDNIVQDSQSVCTKDKLGEDNYNTIAKSYCTSNPDKEFCKCYNVVNYETICANLGQSAGCPAAKEVYDKYVEFKIPDPNVYLPCGKACTGNVYKPSGYNAGCDGTINACIQSVEAGEAHDEINLVCDIDSGAEGELTGGSSGGSGGSGSSDSSDGSGSVSTSAVEELKKTIAEDKKKEDEESKKTKKKLLIGGGGGGIISSISFLMLIVLIVIVMSKKGGGRRRR